MGVTIRDLAKHCGLSMSAVSKALNGYSDISDATRMAVQQAAKELDYHPNAHARALKAGRSYNLGVLFSDDTQSGLTHPFFSVVLEHFKREAEKSGYDITFIGHHMGSGRITYLDHCRYREVDGICVACTNFYDDEVLNLVQSDFPLVTIDHVFEGLPCVFSDNDAGIQMLVNWAYEQGHRRIAYIHGEPSAVTDVRLAGFRNAMQALGLDLPNEYLRSCQYANPTKAQSAAEALLSLTNPPTCILICDDYAALGALRAATKAGLKVPRDLSLAGFDGIEQMQLFSPRLTTVYQDAPRIGLEAARLLISLIESRQTPGEVVVPCRLIHGETIRRLI